MKESIGSTWLFGIVITFIVLFASIVSMSVNWSRAYKVKDEIINDIEKTHGFKQETMDSIAAYMRRVGYRSTGTCPDENYKGYTINGNATITSMWNAGGTNYCVKRVDVVKKDETGATVTGSPGHISSAYYSVTVFFKLDLPVFGNVIRMDVSGETATIFGINDEG